MHATRLSLPLLRLAPIAAFEKTCYSPPTGAFLVDFPLHTRPTIAAFSRRLAQNCPKGVWLERPSSFATSPQRPPDLKKGLRLIVLLAIVMKAPTVSASYFFRVTACHSAASSLPRIVYTGTRAFSSLACTFVIRSANVAFLCLAIMPPVASSTFLTTDIAQLCCFPRRCIDFFETYCKHQAWSHFLL